MPSPETSRLFAAPARSRVRVHSSPETFRPDAATRAWLAAEAQRRGVSKTDIILAALQREREQAGSAASPHSIPSQEEPPRT